MSQRHTGSSARSGGSRDARHHFAWYPKPKHRGQFFTTPAKDKRISAFQAHHAAAHAGMFEQELDDFVLRHAVLTTSLAHMNEFAVFTAITEQSFSRQIIVNHDVSLRQTVAATHCDQFRITGACTD